MPKLRTAAMSLAELLTYCLRYTVPDYQRVYAWGENQIDRLLSDLEPAGGARGTPWLYFGTLYLAGPADHSRAEIADGQQRILTATMLFAAGRDLAEDPADAARLHAMLVSDAGRGGKAAFRFSPRDSDAAFFREWVQEPRATLRPHGLDAPDAGEKDAPDGADGALSESRTHIIDNRDSIVAKLRALGEGGRRRLFETLETATQVVVITAPTLEEARNAYASTQSRGLAQAQTDKLKAELLGDMPIALRRRLASRWEKCEADLGRDNFAELFHHLVFMESRRKPQHALEVDLTSVFGLPKRIEPFIEEVLVPAAAAYKRLLDARKASGLLQGTTPERRRQRRINGHLVSLLRTDHAAWKAPAVLALWQLADDSKALELFLQKLERLAAVMMIVGTDPNKIYERYAAVIRDFRGKSTGRGASMRIDAAEIAKARACLLEERFALRTRFRTAVLMKLEDLHMGEVQAFEVGQVSCEHILPRSPPRRSQWRRDFSDAGGAYFGGRYTHRLGNMTILTHEHNRLADTATYDVKRKILKESGFALSRDAAAKYKVWTPEVIAERSQYLSNLLIEHWRLHAD